MSSYSQVVGGDVSVNDMLQFGQSDRLRDGSETNENLTIRIVGGDVRVVRTRRYGLCGAFRNWARGQIERFSENSRRRMLDSLRARCWSFVPYAFFTLTYGSEWPTDGKIVKRHIKRFLDRIERRYEGIQLFWFIEFQQRGAPHVHIYASRGVSHNRLWLHWQWASSGMGGRVDARKITHDHAAYALKTASGYSAKSGQKEIPVEYRDVGRFWGWRNAPPAVSAVVSIDPLYSPWLDVVRGFVNEWIVDGWLRFSSLTVDYCLAYSRFRMPVERVLRVISDFVLVADTADSGIFIRYPDGPLLDVGV